MELVKNILIKHMSNLFPTNLNNIAAIEHFMSIYINSFQYENVSSTLIMINYLDIFKDLKITLFLGSIYKKHLESFKILVSIHKNYLIKNKIILIFLDNDYDKEKILDFCFIHNTILYHLFTFHFHEYYDSCCFSINNKKKNIMFDFDSQDENNVGIYNTPSDFYYKKTGIDTIYDSKIKLVKKLVQNIFILTHFNFSINFYDVIFI
jgi:hypothetical protein